MPGRTAPGMPIAPMARPIMPPRIYVCTPSFALRMRPMRAALGLTALTSGPMETTLSCTSLDSARSDITAPWSRRFSRINRSRSGGAVAPGHISPCIMGEGADICWGSNDGTGDTKLPPPDRGGPDGPWRFASRILPMSAPLGLTQLIRGPRSRTASCIGGGSTLRSRAAGASMRFSWMNRSTSWTSISFMILISSGDRPESSPSPSRRPPSAASFCALRF
mmetsp:Transcript_15890/g.43543  ORF Transcript_15890/g.43543 Transcript_15890/m.43543 type:complete len:221 (+) Transcript_15890:489-1151(+)